ncbi:MAG: RidA family protein [Fibrobacterota bacterium]|jgi:2-iminobutanoate/2-iminopropanoate deaminase
MKIITSKNAPSAIGPYSPGIFHNGMLFLSGQLGIDPQSGALVADDTAQQAEQVMKNMKTLLNETGFDFNNVVKTTIFLQSLDDFKIVNEIYARYFGDHKPARSTVQVAKLPLGAKVEIESISIEL